MMECVCGVREGRKMHYVIGRTTIHSEGGARADRIVWQSGPQRTKWQAQRALAYIRIRVSEGTASPLLQYSVVKGVPTQRRGKDEG